MMWYGVVWWEKNEKGRGSSLLEPFALLLILIPIPIPIARGRERSIDL